MCNNNSIIPIIKNRGGEIENYRPIALTSKIAKLSQRVNLKSLLRKKRRLIYESDDILPKSRHGFRKRLSPITAIADYLTAIYDNLNKS